MLREMRQPARLALLALVVLPMLGIFFLPSLIDRLNRHTKEDVYAQCERQFSRVAGKRFALTNPHFYDYYCDCVSDEMLALQKRMPGAVRYIWRTLAINAATRAYSSCHFQPDEVPHVPGTPAPPLVTKDPNGGETVYFH